MRGVAVVAVMGATIPASLAQHLDIQVQVAGGVISTGRVNRDVPPPFPIEPDVRVFTGAFGEFPNFTDDPGFNAAAGTTNPGRAFGFNIMDALRKWDGSDFDAIPPERLSISLSATSRMTPTSPGQFVGGFNFVAADAQGGFHQHINYFLGLPQTQGIYALKLELTSPGLTSSLPLWIVLRQGNTPALVQAQSDAVAYLEAQLQPPACPGDADGDGMVGLGDLALMIQNWDTAVPAGTQGDLDQDGFVGLSDLAIAIQNWDSVCP